MTRREPAWALTDEALVLILHAESDMARTAAGSEVFPAPVARGRLTAARNDRQWSRESAILRLISTIEAYTDAASNRWLEVKGLQAPAKPPFSWPQRVKHYAVTHTIDLTKCAGWDKVDAGINLRNCLAHGLGALTPVSPRGPRRRPTDAVHTRRRARWSHARPPDDSAAVGDRVPRLRSRPRESPRRDTLIVARPSRRKDAVVRWRWLGAITSVSRLRVVVRGFLIVPGMGGPRYWLDRVRRSLGRADRRAFVQVV